MKKLLAILLTTIIAGIAAPTFAEENLNTVQTESIVLYVNINQDDAEKMADLLNGVGMKKAQAIVAYRNANGPFKAIDDLVNVPGIGAATLEKNRAAITLSTGGA